MKEKSRIKVLFIIDFLKGFGGTERHLHHLLKNIDRKRFECYLFSFQSNPNFLKNFENYCHVLPWSLNRIYNWHAVRVAANLIRFLKEENIDIVQTFHIGPDIYGTFVSKMAKIPLIISSRRDLGSYRTGRFRMVDRFSNPLIHRFLSVCDAVTESMVKEGIPEDKITRIYNGLSPSQWPVPNGKFKGRVKKTLKINKSSFVIGNISHFRPEKGYEVFFAAIKKVAPKIPDLKVIALGRSGKDYDFKEFVQQDSILKEIVTINYAEDIREYIYIFDIACLTPISNEGFSNAILEQMAAAKPVIATDVGGNAEAVVDGETGYIIPPNDVEALEQSILKLYYNPKLRIQMGLAGRERVETYFTLDRMISSFENYYAKTLEEVRK